jgi:chromosome segregation ATPase
MTDLVQRLRQESSVLISAYETHTRDLVREAADEIERLTKKAQGLALDCHALNEQGADLVAKLADANAEIERLMGKTSLAEIRLENAREVVRVTGDALDNQRSRADRAEAEVERLRAEIAALHSQYIDV